MAYQYLLVDAQADHVVITLNRPKANALSLELMTELLAALRAAEADASVRSIFITGGTGKIFAAGADIPSLASSRENPLVAGGLLAEGLKTINAIEACEKPVVALVNGMALGGGCELCLACHIRIAAETASFGQPEINLGIIPGWGGTHRLPQLVGESRAREWLLTARTIGAAEALQAGLVSEVVPLEELPAAGARLAAVLASKPAVATAQILRVLRERVLHPERGQALEAEAFAVSARSADAGEGIAAFLEKRKPNFTGA
jgi:enoyl-CoA hydratase/carnithine racemase